MSYQDDVGQLQKAGFSGQEVQTWSDKQAAHLLDAGFKQDEVDSYQGMKPPAQPGGTPVYGRIPTDDDFHNAASVIMRGNDHPFYEKAVDTLKGLFTETGVHPTDAVKIANAVPSFQEIMENGGDAPTWGDYGAKLSHDAGSAIASGMKGLAAIKSYVNPNDPGVPFSEQGANPETSQMYQKGAAFQNWIDDKLPANQKMEQQNPIKMGLAGGIGSLIPLLATGGVGMAASGAGTSYEEAKQAGASPEKASAQAAKMGAVWGVLGIVDVGAFLKPIERSAPGVIPWITAKAAQAVRIGLTFAGTNELGDWLSSEIGQASDIPLQYKPTVQRVVTNALLGVMVGTVVPTGVKGKDLRGKQDERPQEQSGQPPPDEPPSPPPSASAQKLTPAYHFDTDTYGVKNAKGEFIKTGLGSEDEAAGAAREMSQPEPKVAIPPEVVERYKQTVKDKADELGFALTPEQTEQAAKVLAESHNPEGADKPRPLAEVQSGKPKTEPSKAPEVPKPQAVEVAPRPVPPEAFPKLPKDLSGAKSGYRNATPQFSSDVDKALYTVREKAGKANNKRHADYINYLKNTVGLSDAEIKQGSADVLAAVKQNAEGQTGAVNIPKVFTRSKSIEINVPKKRVAAPFKNPNAIQLASELGGLKDESGELKAMDAHKAFVPGRGRLVRDSGISLDQFGEALQDRGYFTERPTKSEVLEVIRDGLNGKHAYAEGDRSAIEAKSEASSKDEYHEDLERHAGEMGIDTTGMKPEEIRAELEKQLREAAEEHNFLDKIDDEEEVMRRPYYPEGEQEYAHETVAPGAHQGHGSEISPSDERPEPEAGNKGGGEGAEPFDTSLSRHAQDGAAGRDDNEPAQDGATERNTLGAYEDEDRGEFLFQKGTTEVTNPQHIELLKSVDDYLNRVLPDKYRHETTSEPMKDEDGNDVYGLTDRTKKMITISLMTPDQFETGAHEALHAVREVLTDAEWQTLLDEAKEKGLREKYNIDDRYHSDQEEETIAHWYADWQKGRVETSEGAKGIFDKIKELFNTIASKIRSVFGTDSAEDIFKKIESGDVGKRDGGKELGGLLAQKAEKPTLGDALRGIRDTLSPTSAGRLAKPTEIALRGSYGEAKRQRAIAETALNEFARQANEMTPQEHADFYRYVEGRSSGAKLKNPQFQRMADAIRKVYAGYKEALQQMPETRMMNFVTDYFTHQWAKGQDEQIKEFMNSWWQQGSGRNLKERKIPTIADGLAYGLRLEEPNPVRAVSRYVGSMSNYIASVNVLRAINTDLGGAFYADGKQPGDYAPLVGRNAERIEDARVDPESGKLVPARSLHLYAPKEVADLYNAFYSKGFEETKLGSAYTIARNAINANTMLELGLSAYHFSTINMQSFNQDMSRIIRNALAGDWHGVGQAVLGLVTPALHFIDGSKLLEQYKDMKDHGVDMERIANLFAQSNLRIGIDPLSNVSTHGGFLKAWQRGELPALIAKLKSQMTEDYGLGALKTGAEVVTRIVSDVSHPLFNVYVPAIKMASFHDLMGDWLRQNPDASDGEISVNAIRIGNMVEDRFGEMNMENIFWSQKAKQLLGLGLRAPGWDIGLLRQVGGAALDVYKILGDATKGKMKPNNLDRPLFMVGSIMAYVAMNAAMTYAKTGVAPSDQKLQDWIAYATGGVHHAFGWHPERGELPGHGRELIQMAPIPGKGVLSGVEQEASNKVATLPRKIYEAADNTDWNGKPVYDPKSNSWIKRTPGVAQFAHIATGFQPFSMQQLFEGQAPGSKLSFGERFMGVRAAGAKIVAPDELKSFNERHHN